MERTNDADQAWSLIDAIRRKIDAVPHVTRQTTHVQLTAEIRKDVAETHCHRVRICPHQSVTPADRERGVKCLYFLERREQKMSPRDAISLSAWTERWANFLPEDARWELRAIGNRGEEGSGAGRSR